MATINLGAIKFNWKGAYNSSTSYAVDDVVSSSGNSYVCIQAHSTAQAVGNATAYWNIMSSAGTNGTDGTDLSSLLSTRGDLVFKNASALARLPKGTSGYFLKQGANDPEWGAVDLTNLSATNLTSGTIPNARYGTPTFSGANLTNLPVSADFVKLASGNFPTSATTLNIDNVFTSGTYKIYKVFFSNMNFSGGNSGMGVRMLNTSGSDHGSNEYSYIQTDNYRTSGSNNPGTGGQWNVNSWMFNNWNWADNSDSTKRSGGELTFYDPMDNSSKQLMNYSIIQWEEAGGYFISFYGSATLNSGTQQFRGMNFRSIGGHTFAGGTYSVYGLKH